VIQSVEAVVRKRRKRKNKLQKKMMGNSVE
jgi:hypothetical protein